MGATHVIATVGQIGHGKSALIHALTGMEQDRPADERRRELTIDSDLGWLALRSGARLALAEMPGSERLTGATVAGVGAVAAVIVVVAADEGWTPKAAEQLALVTALGVTHGLLVVTKSDIADPAPALAEAAAWIAQSGLGSVPATAVSSVTRSGLPELVTALDELCARLPEPDPGAPVRIWIERSVSTPANGTVVTGALPAGTVHRDDELLVTPAMRPVRVRELRSLDELADSVAGAAKVALHLRGVGRDALHRGMALVQPGRWTLTDVVDVRVSVAGQPGADGRPWLPAQRSPAAPGQLARTVSLHAGPARVVARVRPLGPGIARLMLADPLPLHVGDRVLLRDPGGRRAGSGPAAAGAVVLDVAPPPLARRGAAAAAARQLASWPDRPGAAELLGRHGLMRASALLAMGVAELPAPLTGEWLADPDRWRALSHQLGEVLAAHAATEPLAAGLPIEAARAALDLPDRRLVIALARPPFRISCGAVHIVPSGPQTSAALAETALAAIRVLRADLAAAPFVSPDAERLRKLGLDARSIAAAVRAGELMRISDQVVLAPGADAAAAAILASLPQPFTAAEARQALGTTRRTAIPLLEHLDSEGITERLEDDRRVVRAPGGRQPQSVQPVQPAEVAVAAAGSGQPGAVGDR